MAALLKGGSLLEGLQLLGLILHRAGVLEAGGAGSAHRCHRSVGVEGF